MVIIRNRRLNKWPFGRRKMNGSEFGNRRRLYVCLLHEQATAPGRNRFRLIRIWKVASWEYGLGNTIPINNHPQDRQRQRRGTLHGEFMLEIMATPSLDG